MRKRPAEVVVTIRYVRPLLSLDGRGRFLFRLDPALGAELEFEGEGGVTEYAQRT